MSPACQTSQGLSWRPLTAGDVQAIFELEAAGEAFDDGVVEVALSDIEAAWSRPDFDPEGMSLGAFAGESLVAYAQLFQGRSEALVHPEFRGRGLGTVLARWTWEVARAEGRDRVGQTISDNERSAASLLESLGYSPSFTACILRIDLTEPRPVPQLPGSYRFTPYLPEERDHELFTLIDQAFDEWRTADARSMGFENWVPSVLRCARSDWVVLISDDVGLVGAAIGLDHGPGEEGWIEEVAVNRAHRGQGLGRALLEESFRRFQEAGRTAGGVSTDSRTGAQGFYERAGMRIARGYTRWTKIGLEPGT